MSLSSDTAVPGTTTLPLQLDGGLIALLDVDLPALDAIWLSKGPCLLVDTALRLLLVDPLSSLCLDPGQYP